MKKLLILLTAALLTVSAHAKVGTIAGTYYSTDIVTSLNGAAITAINIGGNTLIDAEAMADYGFTVVWDGRARTLSIDAASTTRQPPVVQVPVHSAGTPLGYYYKTDIVTLLDGSPITAYNIGGRTFLHAEAMADFGYGVVWDGEGRTLSITSPLSAFTVPLSQGEAMTEEAAGSFSIRWTPERIARSGDTEYFNSALSFDGTAWYLRMEFYQNLGLYKATALIEALDEMKYFDVTGFQCEKEEKYPLTGAQLVLTVNGRPARNIAVSRSQGNGHVDFTLTFEGLPKLKEGDLREITFALNP